MNEWLNLGMGTGALNDRLWVIWKISRGGALRRERPPKVKTTKSPLGRRLDPSVRQDSRRELSVPSGCVVGQPGHARDQRGKACIRRGEDLVEYAAANIARQCLLIGKTMVTEQHAPSPSPRAWEVRQPDVGVDAANAGYLMPS